MVSEVKIRAFVVIVRIAHGCSLQMNLWIERIITNAWGWSGSKEKKEKKKTLSLSATACEYFQYILCKWKIVPEKR